MGLAQVLSLVEFLVLTLILAHWLACIYVLVGRLSGDGVLTVPPAAPKPRPGAAPRPLRNGCLLAGRGAGRPSHALT